MEVTFLVGSIFSPIASVLGLIMNAIFTFFSMFGIHNIALSIFVFTFIIKMLMLPLTIKQQKATRMTSRMNPELQSIQAKYKGKKDEASMKKMKAETDALYQKYGANPASGCLPMLIMLPIMFALYEVINNIPNHVNLIRDQYNTIADFVLNNNLTSDIVLNLSNKVQVSVDELTNTSSIIGVLSKFTLDNWNALLTKVSGPAVDSINYIKNVGNFFGLNIANNPDWKSPAVIVPILAMVLQFIQSKQLQVKNNNPKNDNPTANAMNSMNVVMPIMSGFFCLMLPIGVGIYWIANSLFSIVQQFIVNKHLDKVNIDDMIEQNLEKVSKKYAGKNNSGVSLTELAKKQTKAIDSTVIPTNSNKEETTFKEEKVSQSADKEPTNQPTSITDIANLLKNRNEKGDK